MKIGFGAIGKGYAADKVKELLVSKQVPAGTRIVHRTIYDNSANNRGNPAPEEDVYWGLQSEEEMLYGSMGFTWTNETTEQPTHNPQVSELLQVMGFWDQNLDNLISLDELRLPSAVRLIALVSGLRYLRP